MYILGLIHAQICTSSNTCLARTHASMTTAYRGGVSGVQDNYMHRRNQGTHVHRMIQFDRHRATARHTRAGRGKRRVGKPVHSEGL